MLENWYKAEDLWSQLSDLHNDQKEFELIVDLTYSSNRLGYKSHGIEIYVMYTRIYSSMCVSTTNIN